MAAKYIVGIVLGCLAFILFCVAAAIPVVTFTNGSLVYSAGYFKLCVRHPTAGSACASPQYSCGAQKSIFQATAAMIIIAVLCCATYAIFAITRVAKRDLFNKIPFIGTHIKLIFYGLLIATVLFGFLGMVLGFAIFSSKFCGFKISDSEGSGIGGSAPVCLIATIMVAVQLGLEFFMQDDAEEGEFSSSNGETTTQQVTTTTTYNQTTTVTQSNNVDNM